MKGFRVLRPRSAVVTARRLLAVALVVAVVAATFAIFLPEDDDPPAATSTTSTTGPVSTEDLTEVGKELVGLLQRAREITYHAGYEGTSPDAAGASITLETWQKPPLIRQDSALTAAGEMARTSSFVLPDGGVRCTQVGDAPWTCRAAATGELRADPISGAVVEQLRDSDVRVRSTEVEGVDVRCFTLTSLEGAASELCLDADGITVRVRAGGSELRRVAVSREFGDDVFEPPAAVAD